MSTQTSTTSGSPTGETDQDLLRRISGGDRDAFVAFFERYAGRVKSFVLRWGVNEQDADEIAQDTMVQVWRRASTFDAEKAAVSTWVFTIARNRKIDRLRKLGRAEVDVNDPLYQPDPEPDGAALLSVQEREAKIRGAMAALSEDQLQVVYASFYDGQSHSEIASSLDIPLGTVKSRIRLAFKALKDALGEEMQEELLDD